MWLVTLFVTTAVWFWLPAAPGIRACLSALLSLPVVVVPGLFFAADWRRSLAEVAKMAEAGAWGKLYLRLESRRRDEQRSRFRLRGNNW
ncbi:MAG: hypothetical protein H5U00_12260 [Clostridia bacterium]|nr:hypothetical protein [Clostridia bacterium]